MIRLATVTDTPTVRDLLVGEYREMREYGATLDADKLDRAIEYTFESPYAEILVSEKDGDINGLLWFEVGDHLTWSSDLIATDIAVYVLPDSRGGYTGAALVKAYVKAAKEKGAVTAYISCNTGIHEDKTSAFYQKLGFTSHGNDHFMRIES